jgi:hypothetical protein
MAEERTLGLARVREADDERTSKEELQRRMDDARDSITHTVGEIKESVAQQYESVKDALDWREHFKKRPVAWSLGAAGVGFFVGYGIASALSEDEPREGYYSGSSIPSTAHVYAAQPVLAETVSRTPAKTNGKDQGPGMLERLKETSAYERLSKEAGTLGDRLIEELSATAQAVVLPALLKKIKGWIGVDLSAKNQTSLADKSASMGSRPLENKIDRGSYDPSIESSREF